MSNRLDMEKDTNNRKDKTKYDGPEKPDAYMGNDKQWVFRALVLAFIDMCIIAISFFFALMIRFEFSYSHIPLSFLEGYLHKNRHQLYALKSPQSALDICHL